MEFNIKKANYEVLFSTIKASPLSKLAIITLDSNKINKHLEIFSFVLSQLQIFSVFLQVILLSTKEDSRALASILRAFHHLIFVGDYLDFATYPELSYSTIIITCLYTMQGIFWLIYSLRLLSKDKLPPTNLHKIWSISAYLHCIILFYPVHSIYVNVISSHSNGTIQFFGIQGYSDVLHIFLYVPLIINFLYSLVTLFCAQTPLKTSHMLSSKTTLIIIGDICIKFVSHFLVMLIGFNTEVYSILTSVIIFVFSIIRDGIFFQILPYYKLLMLRLAAKAHSLLTLFAFCGLCLKLLSFIFDEANNVTYVVITWIIISPLFVKLYGQILEKISKNILFSASEKSKPLQLLHYWWIYKGSQLKNKTKYRENYVFYNALLGQSKQKSDLVTSKSASFAENKLLSKEYALDSTINLLNSCLDNHPRLFLIRTTLALYHTKHQKSYQTADQLIQKGLELSPPFHQAISLYLVRLRILRKLKDDSAQRPSDEIDEVQNKKNLSFDGYLCLQESLQKLKESIKEQLNPQIEFWQHYQSPNSNFDTLINLAKSSYVKGKLIKKYLDINQRFLESWSLEAMFIRGLYESFLRNNTATGEKLIMKYFYEKVKVNINTFDENPKNHMLSTNAVYFILSPSSNNFGTILDCSENITRILQYKKETLIGKSINDLALYMEKESEESFLGIKIKDTLEYITNASHEVKVIDKNGRIVSCWMSYALEFLPRTGISYFLLLKPIVDTKRILILQQNGSILQYSENFGKDMNLTSKSSKLNAFSFCPKLKRIIEAFQYKSIDKTDFEKLRPLKTLYTLKSTSKGKTNLKETDLQRLYEKYTKGSKLIFYPHSSTSKSVNTLPATLQQIRETATTIIYEALLQTHSTQKGVIIEVSLEKLSDKDVKPLHADFESLRLRTSVSPKSKTSERKKFLRTSISSSNDENRMKINKPPVTYYPNSQALPSHGPKICTLDIGDAFPHFHALKIDYHSGTDEDPKIHLRHKRENVEKDRSLVVNSSKQELFRTELNSDSSLQIDHVEDKRLGFHSGKKEDHSQQQTETKSCNPKNAGTRKNSLVKNGVMTLTYGQTSKSDKIKIARAEKIIQEILKSRQHTKPTFFYSLYFSTTITFLLGCLMWFSFNASIVSLQVDTISQALQNLYLRCFWTNLANQETRMWAGVRGGLFEISQFVTIEMQTETSNMTFHKMDEYNHKLWEASIDVGPDFQALINKKNVDIFERDDENNLKVVSTENTYQVITEIISNGFVNVYRPFPEEAVENYIEKEARFIFDNSFEGLLIESEYLIEVLKGKVESAFSSAESVNFIILWAGISANILFIIISLSFVLKTSRELNRFLKILLTLPKEEAARVEKSLLTFQEMLDKNCDESDCSKILDKIDGHVNLRDCNQSPTKRPINLIHFHDSAERMKRKNIFLFIRLMLAQLLLVGCLIFYYTWSLDRVQVMQKQHVIINSALENINLQSLMSVELQALVMDNSTGTIRGIPIIESLANDVDKLSQTTELQKKFKNEKNELPEKQRQILSSMDCSEIFSTLYLLDAPTVMEECVDASHGRNITGLIDIISQMTFELSTFLTDFPSMEKDEETLNQVYEDSTQVFITYIDLATTFFLLSYEYTQTDFINLIQELKDKGPVFAVIALLFVVLVVISSWIFGIRHLRREKFDPKKVLTLLPTRLVLENLYIKKYVEQIADSDMKNKLHLLQ